MIKVRTFSDVPDDRLKQLVGDLQKEVDKDAIHVSSQTDGKWQVAVAFEDRPKPTAATVPPSVSGGLFGLR